MPDPRRDQDPRLHRLADEQAALRRVATLVARGVRPDEIFSAVTNEIGRLFGSEAAIARFEANGSAMVVVGVTPGIPVVSIGTRWPLEDFLASTGVYRTGRPARNDHTSHHDASGLVADSLRQMDFVSTVAAPIVVEGSLWGTITVSDNRERLPEDTEERVAKFTELVGTAIANAESRAELAASEARARDLAGEQAALRRVATLVASGACPSDVFSVVCDEVGGVIGSDAVTVGRYESDGSGVVFVGSKGLRRVSVGTRLPLEDFLVATMVYRTGRTARRDEKDSEPVSGPVADILKETKVVSRVGVPIVVEGKLWGVITVLDTRGPLPPDTEERVAKFTELVATAIAESESRSHLAQLVSEQAALRRVAMLVAQDVPSSELFGAVAGEVGTLFAADFTAMVRYGPDPSLVTTMAFWAAAGGEHPPAPSGPCTAPGDPTSRVAATGKPTRVDDWTDAPGPIAEFLRDQLKVRSSVGGPIVVEERLWGGLALHSKGDPFPPDTEQRLLNFSELVATAIANTDARAEVSRLADEQAALRRVATLVAQGVSPEDVFSVVSNEVGQLFGSGQAAVGRYEPDGSGVVYVGVSAGLRLRGMEVGTHWPLEDYLTTTTVYRTGRPARQEKREYETASGPVADTLRKLNVVSRVGAPIVVEGKLWGVITVADTREDLPLDAEERVAKFTELVATAIANTESRAELAASESRARDLAGEQAALRRVATLVAQGASSHELFVAVAREVADVLGIPVVGLHRFEADGTFTMMGIAGETSFTVGSRWPVVDEGVAGMILATGRPARKDDYAKMPGPLGDAVRNDAMTSTVGVPIVVDGDIWGFMGGAARPGKPIPDGTEKRLARFTELVATAIANSEARAYLAQLAEEQAALRRVATLVARGVSPEEIFSAVSNEMGRLFGSPQAYVGRFEPDESAMVVVGASDSTRGVSIGSRWELEDYMASTGVSRTGHSVRFERSDFKHVSGPMADLLREIGAVSYVGAPIVVEGQQWGFVTVTEMNKSLPADADERLEKFTELLATAIANAESRDKLAASRARVIVAADDARRRIERDLHDGAQQRLVTLSVALRTMGATMPPGSDEQRAAIARIADGLAAAMQELRELSRGIHPAVLTQGGLAPALKALRRRSPVRVTLDIRFARRLPDQVEAAAYYTVSEALTNASKHASATRVSVVVQLTDGTLHLSIRDDGVGGADPSQGSGLTGLKDRIEALGGRIRIDSAQGSGTRIDVEIPILQPLQSRSDSNGRPD